MPRATRYQRHSFGSIESDIDMHSAIQVVTFLWAILFHIVYRLFRSSIHFLCDSPPPPPLPLALSCCLHEWKRSNWEKFKQWLDWNALRHEIHFAETFFCFIADSLCLGLCSLHSTKEMLGANERKKRCINDRNALKCINPLSV